MGMTPGTSRPEIGVAGLPSVGFVIGWPAEHGSALPGRAASVFGFGWALRHTSDLSSPLIPP